MIQNPAITSLASANGPSVITRLPPDTRSRVPLELGCSPSAPSSTPAFLMSSLNFIMAMTSSFLGGPCSSAPGGAGNNIMKRMVLAPLNLGFQAGVPKNFGHGNSSLYLHVEPRTAESTAFLKYSLRFCEP